MRLLGRRDLVVPAALFLVGVTLHALQGSAIASPWLLPDELRVAAGTRSLAGEGGSGVRTLYSLATAPLWLFGTATGYGLAKALGAVALSLAAFPAYALARMVARPWAAAAAAFGAVCAPATLYASAVLWVNLSYPLAVAGLLFLIRFAVSGSVRAAAASFVSLALAAALWPALLFLLAPAILAGVAWRASWRPFLRWPGASLLVAVPAVAYAAFWIARSESSAVAAAAERWYDLPADALASLGAFAIGLALVPPIAALAAVLGIRQARDAWRALVSFLPAALAFLALGSAVEAATRSAGARALDESVLLAAVPLVLATAAGAVDRLALSRVSLGLGALAVLVAVGFVHASAAESFQPHAPSLELVDGLGLPPLWFALAALAIVPVALAAVALGFGKEGARLRTAAVLTGISVLAMLGGEIVAGRAAHSRADATRRLLPEPPSLAAREAGKRPIAVLSTADSEPELVESLLFWNPRAFTVEPGLADRAVDPATGLFSPPLEVRYAFDLGGDRIGGRVLASSPAGSLIRPATPMRAVQTIEGLFPDGWSGAQAVYRRFRAANGDALDLTVSRAGWGGPDVPSGVTIAVGPLEGTAEPVRRLDIRPGQTIKLSLPAPGHPFRVVIDSQTFSPSSFGQADNRRLGVQLAFAYRERAP